ncbi:MAG: hypothetical protein QOI22_1681, partial [Verrucomicrobiota bacterium]
MEVNSRKLSESIAPTWPSHIIERRAAMFLDELAR